MESDGTESPFHAGTLKRMKIDFSADTRLLHRASIAVISSLWNQDDIISDVKNLLSPNQISKNWVDIENNVLLYLRKIVLPDVLKLNLENLIQPMGMQIFKWISLTRSTYEVYPHLPESIIFFWTERGMLDYTRTTKLIINCTSDKLLCFCIACIFCIEEIILKLWPEVNQTLSKNIRHNPCAVEAIPVIYWVYYLNGEVNNLMTLTEYYGAKNAYEFAFLLLLDTKCICTLNYFLSQIQTERKQKIVFLALQSIFRVTRPHDGNVLIFLLSYLKESDIDQIISENSYSVLASFLEWPCQDFFIPLANSSWSHLSNLNYLNLLQDLIECVSRYYAGDIYLNLTRKFWKSTPLSFKEYVIIKCMSGTFLSRLFLYENTDDIIQMIFNDCNPSQRQEMIFYFEGMNICDLLVKKERWMSLKLLVKNCIPSQSILVEFIVQYEKYKPCYYNKETELRTDILFKKIREWYEEKQEQDSGQFITE